MTCPAFFAFQTGRPAPDSSWTFSVLTTNFYELLLICTSTVIHSATYRPLFMQYIICLHSMFREKSKHFPVSICMQERGLEESNNNRISERNIHLVWSHCFSVLVQAYHNSKKALIDNSPAFLKLICCNSLCIIVQ